MTQKTRNIIGWILTGLVAFTLIGSAIGKLTANEETLKMAAQFGVSAYKLKLIAFTEILSCLLFIFPRTGVLGTLLVTAYMGGAIATHVEHNMPVYIPVIVQCVVWITAVIRFPELGRRLMGNASTPKSIS